MERDGTVVAAKGTGGSGRSKSGQRALAIGVCAAVAMLLLVPHAGATRRSAPSSYREAAVVKAFKSQGLSLFDPAFGQPNSVKVLSSVKAHDGWKLGIYIYPTTKFATASFLGGRKQWAASGIAALRLKNLVVTAVPSGRTLDQEGENLSDAEARARGTRSAPGRLSPVETRSEG